MAFSSGHDESGLILDYFKAHPRSGTMIDVGAQFGTSFRDYLAMGWRVVAIEPDATKHEKLAKYREDHRFTLIMDAVGAREQEAAAFYTSPESNGISSLLPFRQSHTESAKVRVTTLRKIMAEQGIERLDYLKVDTEGYDLAVLRGYPWERTRPEVVMAEFDEIKTVHMQHTYRETGDFLVDQGYEVYLSEWMPIVRYGVEHTWRSIRRYPCELENEKAWGNFVAVLEDAQVGTMRELVEAHQSDGK